MICVDCQRAEIDKNYPIYNGLPCCEARHLMALPARFRREVAQKLKRCTSTEYWHEMRERLDVLMEREGAES